MAISLAKYGKFGFQLQTAEGTEADGSSVVWLPLCDRPTFNLTLNGEVLEEADRNFYDHLMYSRGKWYAGTVPVYLYPGATANLITWIQTRDSSNQGSCATVYLVMKNGTMVAYDVKVGSADFRFEVGAPIRCELTLVGKHSGSSTPTGSSATIQDGAYLFHECTLSTQLPGESLTTNYDIKDLSLTIDNHVIDPSDGMRFNGSLEPYRLYNEASETCTGSFSRDYVDNDFYDLYLNQYTSAVWYDTTYDMGMQIVLARSSVSLTFTLPRVRMLSWDHGMIGSNKGIQTEAIDFAALGSMDGTTSPITLS